MDRDLLTTGNEELDLVLGGGLTPGSLLVIAGEPGTGKTVLAQQLSFANATEDRPVRYYTTLSEAHAKLVRHLSGFSFFDPDAIGRRVHYLHLTEFAQHARESGEGIARIIDEIVTAGFEQQPSVIVLDSSKALRQFTDVSDLREGVFELASKLGHSGALLIFVGEYTSEEFADAPEFAVADAIIHVTNDRDGPQDRRSLRVVKLRGRRFLHGQHGFDITSDGYQVHARVETVAPAETPLGDGRASLGIEEFDAMTHGGIPVGDTALIFGPSGAGKTTVAGRFLSGGLMRDQRALLVSMEETVEELRDRAQRFGPGFAAGLDDGRLRVVHVPVATMDLDRVGHEIRRAVADHDPHRVAIDPVSGLIREAQQAGRFPRYPAALTNVARERGATLLLTYEVGTLGGAGATFEVSNMAHDVLVLRYMERGSELGRVFSVLKMRRSQHDKGLLQYEIVPDGIRSVGEAGEVQQITGWTVLGSATGGTRN